VDYFLTHYYRRGTSPFRSLSALPEDEAIRVMESLYDATSLIMMRFEDPHKYLRDRRASEQWVRQAFIAKGGQPQALYPHYMVFGDSPWTLKAAAALDTAIIRIPLSAFNTTDVSFTYPDSMISAWLGSDKLPGLYLPEFHGKVFTIPEILAIVEQRGLPEREWQSNLPDDLAPYIEAQVWNHELLSQF
jgi:hypothetical protein